MVVTISSRKGGCGKTVLAMILAAALAEEGADVVLLDADPNHAAHRWATETRNPPVRAHAEADAERLGEAAAGSGGPARAADCRYGRFRNAGATVAAAAADLVLVPVTPGEGDLTEAQRTVASSRGWPQHPPGDPGPGGGQPHPTRHHPLAACCWPSWGRWACHACRPS